MDTYFRFPVRVEISTGDVTIGGPDRYKETPPDERRFAFGARDGQFQTAVRRRPATFKALENKPPGAASRDYVYMS